MLASRHGGVEGQLQGERPRHRPLGINATEVHAHDYEAIEPQAWPLKQDLRDVPMDGLVSEMGDGLNLARLADCNALVLLQDKIVGVVQLGHLVRVRFLDGEEVANPFQSGLRAGFARHRLRSSS